MKLFVSGGCGFIGVNFIRYALKTMPDVEIVNFDKLTYAGNLESLSGIEDDPRYTFVRGDIADGRAVMSAVDASFDAIINFAAESHVDRSILESADFMRTNVVGTERLLTAAKQRRTGVFLQVSTDEVYGPAPPGKSFSEYAPLAPTSPYAASKAAADLVAMSFFRTHGVPVMITRCTNNFGPYQFPEKLIPFFITRALAEQKLPLYGDGSQRRDWIFVEDHCRALVELLKEPLPGEILNIAGGNELTNLQLTMRILDLVGRKKELIAFVEDRPAHDRRYALDCSKMMRLTGWEPVYGFDESLKRTVKWYVENEAWLGSVRDGRYLEYYEKQYGKRLG